MKTPPFKAAAEHPPLWPPIFLQRPEAQPIIGPITVGIAAICDGGNAIVMAADRLVSVSEASLSKEMDRKKMSELVPGIWMAMTGTLQDAEYSRERFSQMLQPVPGQSVFEVAERLRKASEYICEKQVEDCVVRPRLGISYARFKKVCVENTTNDIIKDVYTATVNHKFDLELMLGGFDRESARIYRVTFMSVNSHEGLGYTSIGIGRTVAAAMLTRHAQSTISQPLAEAIYRVYEAKRASEQTKLVGDTTDMLVLHKGCKGEFLSADAIAALENVYEQRRPSPLSTKELGAIEGILPQATPRSPKASESSKPSPRGRRRRRGSGD